MLIPNVILFIVTLSALSLINSAEDELIDERIYDEVKNGVLINKFEDFQEFMSRNDITFLAYFYSKNHTLSKTGAYFLYKLENKLDFIGKTVFINCDRVTQRDKIPDCNMKDPKNKDEFLFPRLKMFAPPKEKFNQITKKMNGYEERLFKSTSVSGDSMMKEIIDNLVVHYIDITSKNIDSFIQTQNFNKVLIFLDKSTKEASSEYNNVLKGISNIYYNRVLIGLCYDEEIAKQYKVETYPKAFAFRNSFFRRDKPEVISIDKDISNKYLLDEVLSQYALKEKYYIRRLFELTLEEVKTFPLFPNTFHIFFERFKDYPKIVIFSSSNDNNSLLSDLISRFNGLVIFGKINCKNFSNLCEEYFNVKLSNKGTIVKFYPKTQDIKSSLDSGVTYDINDQLILRIASHFTSNTQIVSSSELSKQVFQSRNDEKYISLFLYSKTQVNDLNTFKAFSSIREYRKKIDFISLEDPSEKLLKLLKIKSLPANVFIYHNKLAEEGFKHQTINEIKVLEMRKLAEKYITDREFEDEEIKEYLFPIDIMDDVYYLLSRCIFTTRDCYIALVNGEYDKKTKYVNNDYYKTIDLIYNTTNNEGLLSASAFFVVNATCNVEILKSFKLQFSQLPAIIKYNGHYENADKLTNFNSTEQISQLISSVNMRFPITKKSIEVSRVRCEKVKEHKDFNFKFDYGGVEFEENDTEDLDLNLEEGVEKTNIGQEYNRQYEKQYEEYKKKQKQQNKGDL